MSEIIDKKIVEFDLDTKDLDKDTERSIKALKRLEEAADFDGLVTGFSNLESAANKLDLSHIAGSINKISDKFSFMGLTGFKVMNQLSDKAIEVGKTLSRDYISMSSLSNVGSGWSKFEQKTTAIHTIMAATAREFEDAEVRMQKVNEQIDRLNWFTDETSYSLMDMVNNVGKFTSNNVPLEQSVTAMQGISTWAGISGANINEAGRAMYNLSQALASGVVRLQDWTSIENANMSTSEFKQTVIDTAVELGKLEKSADGTVRTLSKELSNGWKEGDVVDITSFTQTLDERWFDQEVLMGTLSKYGDFATGLQELMDTLGNASTTRNMLDLIKRIKEQGIESLGDEINRVAADAGMTTKSLSETLQWLASDANDLGYRAFRATQETKTFREAVDYVKEAVSTGWMNTWQSIFGTYDKAKEFFTDLTDRFYDLFVVPLERQNEFISDALRDPIDEWGRYLQSVSEAGISIDKFKDSLKKIASEQGVVIENNDDFNESLKEGWLTTDMLREALKGFEKDIGKGSKLEDNLVFFQKKVNEIWHGDWGNGEDRFQALTKAGYDYYELQDLVNKTVNNRTVTLDMLNESQMKSLGYTEDEIEAIHELVAAAEEANGPIEALIDSLTIKSGRDNITDSILNILDVFVMVKSSFRKAFDNVFGDKVSGLIYNFTDAVYTASQVVYDFFSFLTGADLPDGEEYTGPFVKGLTAIYNILDLVFMLVSDGINTIIGFGLSLGGVIADLVSIPVGIFKNIFGIDDNDEIDSAKMHITDFIQLLHDAYADSRSISGLFSGEYTIINKITNKYKQIAESVKKSSFGQFIGTMYQTLAGAFETAKNKAMEFINYVKMNVTFKEVFDFIKSYLDTLYQTVSNYKPIKDFTNSIRETLSGLVPEELKKLFREKDYEAIGEYIVVGLGNGIKNGAKFVWEKITTFVKDLISHFTTPLEIHSPSKLFERFGMWIMMGLGDGLKKYASYALNGFNGILDWVEKSVLIPIGQSASKGFETFKTYAFNGLKSVAEGFSTSLTWLSENIMAPLNKFIEEGQIMDILKLIQQMRINKLLNATSNFITTFTEIPKTLAKSFEQINKNTVEMTTYARMTFMSVHRIFEDFRTKIMPELTKDISRVVRALKVQAYAKFVTAIADFFLKLALGIGIITASVIAVTFTIDKLKLSATTMSWVAAAIGGFTLVLIMSLQKMFESLQQLSETSAQFDVSNRSGKLVLNGLTQAVGLIGAIFLTMGALAVNMFIFKGMDSAKLLISFGGLYILLKGLSNLIIKLASMKLKNGGEIFEIVADFLKSFSLAMIGVAAAFKVLDLVNYETPEETAFAIIAFVASVASLLGAIATAGFFSSEKFKIDPKAIEAFSTFVKSIALAVLGMAASLFIISLVKIDASNVAGFVIALGAVLAALWGLYQFLSKGAVMTKKMAQAVKEFKGQNLTNLLAGFTNTFNAIGKMFEGIGTSIIKIAAAIVIIDRLSGDSILRSTAVIGGIMGLMFALEHFLSISKNGSQYSDKIGLMFSNMANAVDKIAVAIVAISAMTTGEIWRALGVVGALIAMLGAVEYFTDMSKKGDINSDRVGMMFEKFAIAIGTLVTAVVALSKVPQEQLIQATGAVAIIMLSFAGAMYGASKFLDASKEMNLGSIVKLMLMFGVVLGGIYLIQLQGNQIDSVRTITIAKSVGIILAALGASMYLINKSYSKDNAMGWGDTFRTIILMTGMLAAAVGALWVLKTAKIDANMSAQVLSLVTILEAMAGALWIIGQIPEDGLGKEKVNQFLKAMGVLPLVMVEIAFVLSVLQSFNIKNDVFDLVLPISGIILALAGLVAVIGNIKLSNSDEITKTVGYIAIVGLLIIEVGFIASLLEKTKVSYSTIVKMALYEALILGAIGLTYALSLLPDTVNATSLLGKMAAVGEVIVGVEALFFGTGMLISLFSKFAGVDTQTLVNTAVSAVEAIGEGIGRFVGAIGGGVVGGFRDASTRNLDEVGKNVKSFGESTDEFFKTIKDLPEERLDSVDTLIEKMVSIAALNASGAVVDFSKFKTAFTDLGTGIKNFYTNIEGIDSTKDIDVGNTFLMAIEDLLKVLGSLITNNSNGITEGDLENLFSGLTKLSEKIGEYIKDIGDITILQWMKLDNSIAHIKKFVELYNELATIELKENAGKINVPTNLTEFGEDIAGLARGMVAFNEALNGDDENKVAALGDDDFNRMEKAKNAALKMTEILNALPVLSAGQSVASLSTFSSELSSFGTGIVNFATNIRDMTDDDWANLEKSDSALSAMSKAAEVLNEFAGNTVTPVNLNLFNISLTGLTTGLTNLVSKCNDIMDKEDFSNMATVLGLFITMGVELKKNDIASTLTGLGASISEIDVSGNLKVLSNIFDSLGTSLKNFKENMEGLLGDDKKGMEPIKDAFNVIVEAIQALKKEGVVAYLSKLNVTISEFKTAAINTLAEDLSDDEMFDLNEAGKKVANEFAIGVIEGNDAYVAQAGEEINKKINDTLDYTNNKALQSTIHSSGYNFAYHFADGILDGKYLAVAAAGEMARDALDSTAKTQRSESPSKAAHLLGTYFGEGYANGIEATVDHVVQSASNVAAASLDLLNDPAMKILHTFKERSSQPVIRPVVDLSDVEEKTNTLNGMFDSPLLALSSMGMSSMASKMKVSISQNDGYMDVVDAIKGLQGDIANMNNTTYNVNGITYDDGSNITDAIDTLVRELNIERRK